MLEFTADGRMRRLQVIQLGGMRDGEDGVG